MKTIKRILLVLSIIIIIIVIGFISIEHINEVVDSSQVMIDQEFHRWNVCNDGPVKIELYVRNYGERKVDGTLVFLATLSKKGIEEKFLKEFVDCFGKERLKKEMKEEIKQKSSIGRLKPVYNYLLRDEKLPEGQDYEPVIGSEKDEENYVFKFRKRVEIRSGEIIKIGHEQQIPPNVQGYLFNIAIESIEFQ